MLHYVLYDVFFVTFKENDDSNLRFYEEIFTKGDDMQALQGSEFYQKSILASPFYFSFRYFVEFLSRENLKYRYTIINFVNLYL